ncbi:MULTISPECIES: DUF7344 domain-containing protein [Saliphagus]|uniref:DUF7344 domain-containing protein n=1 Tax=Saliphagus infecundisoli TaxID=1849069 RepID=A0ABD5QGP1_9EURY|nr:MULTISPECIES: hypothetical protein [Saliphagus]
MALTEGKEKGENESAPGPESETDDRPTRGEIFDLLSNHRRRYAIHYCKQQDDPVELGDLAEHVAAWELDKEVAELTSAERKRVYTSLQQTHLPTLERANMVEFDDRTIALTDSAADLDVYLDIVPGDSIPWGVYYLGLSAVAGAVIAGLWLEVVPTETVPTLGWATLLVALFGISAAVHTVENRRSRLGAGDRPP